MLKEKPSEARTVLSRACPNVCSWGGMGKGLQPLLKSCEFEWS